MNLDTKLHWKKTQKMKRTELQTQKCIENIKEEESRTSNTRKCKERRRELIIKHKKCTENTKGDES